MDIGQGVVPQLLEALRPLEELAAVALGGERAPGVVDFIDVEVGYADGDPEAPFGRLGAVECVPLADGLVGAGGDQGHGGGEGAKPDDQSAGRRRRKQRHGLDAQGEGRRRRHCGEHRPRGPSGGDRQRRKAQSRHRGLRDTRGVVRRQGKGDGRGHPQHRAQADQHGESLQSGVGIHLARARQPTAVNAL